MQPQDFTSTKGLLGPGDHPFPVRYAQHFVTMQIDPGMLLRRLTKDAQLAGGHLIVRNLDNFSEILALPEAVVFIGAPRLFANFG
jgi:hypothetical protein